MSLGLNREAAAAAAAADGNEGVDDEDGKSVCCGGVCQYCATARDVGLVLKRARSVVRGPLGGVLLCSEDSSLSGDVVGELRRFLR
mmetsp:Transcript_4448/g.6539  ORF Transcript_4448/g.6539 Transcript_4448/m.6539 type:complete len:86 (-) Transcript_4448:43-300(-)